LYERSEQCEIRTGSYAVSSYGIRIGEVRIFSPTPAMIYIETCIAAFGPDRGMFESNFPPDGVSSSYAVLWNAFKLLAARYSPEDKAKLTSLERTSVNNSTTLI